MTQAAPLTADLLAELAELGIVPAPKSRVDFLFAAQENRRREPLVHAHVQAHELPANSFYRLSEHVLIVCPELCFIQMGEFLSLERLIHAGYELCGTYRLPVADAQPEFRDALSTKAQVSAYIDACGARVVNTSARRAAGYVMDGSASPRESSLAMLLCLPQRLGGYGLPVPVLNHPVQLTPEAYRIYPCNPCRCDLFWPEQRFGVEYQGELHKERYAEDVARAAAFQAVGVDLLAITKEQMADAQAFATVTKTVAANLGVRLRIRREDFAARNARLRRELRV